MLEPSRIRIMIRRLIWPHGVRCLWFCPPWHQPGAYPSYDEYRQRGTDA